MRKTTHTTWALTLLVSGAIHLSASLEQTTSRITPPQLMVSSSGKRTVLTAIAYPGIPFQIESSTDFRSWQVLLRSNTLDGQLQWQVPAPQTASVVSLQPLDGQLMSQVPAAAGISRQFYRIAAIEEEFLGPFASWLDVQRDFGAIGDGIADDTAAIQAGLDAIRPPQAKAVLYFPAGTYRLTRMLEVRRTGHDDSKDIMILGEHPDTTKLVWDGIPNGVMMKFGAWWARLGRLTFDGQGQARSAIIHGDLFSSHNEMSDLVIQDVAIGIEAGAMETGNNGAVAETAVLRCRFKRCGQAGISLQNWNSLDWFIWDSEFIDCNYGVCNVYGAGNFHVYQSAFYQSTTADVAIGNTGYFSVRHCGSTNSARFFQAGGTGAPALVTLQNNTILNPKSSPIQVGNPGPLTLLDNHIQSSVGPAAIMSHPIAHAFAVGNAFAASSLFGGPPQVVGFDNQPVDWEKASRILPVKPPTPPRATASIIELPAGATAQQIQAAVDSIDTNNSRRTIIHLPSGISWIDQPIAVPSGIALQFTGDGGRTILQWHGGANPGDCVVRLQGPVFADLEDLCVNGNGLVPCLEISGCDQAGARIRMDQVDVRHASVAGLWVDRLANTRVDLRGFYHSYSQTGVRVDGPGNLPSSNQQDSIVTLFGGASGGNDLSYEVQENGRLVAQDIWYETSNANQPVFMRCTNSGQFTLHGGMIAPAYSKLSEPTILIDGFQGELAFLGVQFAFPESRLLFRGDGSATSLLLLGTASLATPEFQSTNASLGSFNNLIMSNSGGVKSFIPDLGMPDPDFLKRMLRSTREVRSDSLWPLRKSASDIRLRRVFATTATSNIHLKP